MNYILRCIAKEGPWMGVRKICFGESFTYACRSAERAGGELIGCSGSVYFVPHCEVLRSARMLVANGVASFLPTSRIMALSSAKVSALSKLGVR